MSDINILAPDQMITEDEAVYNELMFNDSSLRFMNPNQRSEEAYFGENNPVKLGLTEHMSNLREIFSKITDKTLSQVERKRAASDMEDYCKIIEASMVKWFNIEKAYVGIFQDLNAFAYPLMYDKNLVEEVGKKKQVNESYRISLEDIVETSNGFRFKTSDKKIFIIGIGCGFFDQGYTDEEVASVVLHEIGHSFQQMLVGINSNLAHNIIHGEIQATHMLLNPFLAIFTGGISYILGLVSGVDAANLQGMDEDDLADELIVQQMSQADRDKWGIDVENVTHRDMKNASKRKDGNKVLKAIGNFILGTLGGIILTCVYVITPIWNYINPLSWPQRFYELANLGFLRGIKRYEQFADMFAANYGLGKQLASALSKMGKEYHKINLYTLNWLNYVPILNVAINIGFYSNASICGLIDEHPETKDRIVALYKTCKFEIENNKDLTAKEKKELSDHIAELHKVYEDYVFSTDSRNFVYGLWKRMTRASLEKEKSTVEENVLSVLQKKKEEEKLEKIKKPKVEMTSEMKIAAFSPKNLADKALGIINEFKKKNILFDLVKKFETPFKNI
jgi:hypothetical protein